MIPVIDQYDVFKTMLLVILTFATVFNGGLAWALYIIIEKRIEDKVIESADEAYFRTTARTLLEVGLMCWRNYKYEVQIEIQESHLVHALEFTNDAYKLYALKLKKGIHVNEQLICILKNNLAYYLTEYCRFGKGTKTDISLAIDYAEYIFKYKSKYPDYAKELCDTYTFVQTNRELYSSEG